MEITIIQILIIIFAFFALTRAILRLKENTITMPEFVFWALIWIVAIVIAILPGIISNIATNVGIASGMSLLVYLSILLLFYLMYRMYAKVDNMDQKLSKIVRELSISRSRKK